MGVGTIEELAGGVGIGGAIVAMGVVAEFGAGSVAVNADVAPTGDLRRGDRAVKGGGVGGHRVKGIWCSGEGKTGLVCCFEVRSHLLSRTDFKTREFALEILFGDRQFANR